DSKENSDDSFVKQQVSEDTSSFVESPLNVDKETTFFVDKKIKFVKPKNYAKQVRKSVRRKDDEGWKEMVDSEIWSLKEDEEEGGGIILALKLSYQELPASLKQLFAYCSLFPKDDLFEKEDLVLLWMAEGFLHQSDHPSKLTEERLGHYYFEELLSRSFFQHAPDDESLFVMHDLMHDLAISVAGEFFFRLEKDMGKDGRKLALEKLRHMSFVREEHEAYEKFMVFKEANCLRTLMSVGVKDRWRTKYLPN
nr:NB-ARC domains-containing protein [Tanacetum cinerariifolium]